MKKQLIQYTSPIDALIAVTNRLSTYETQHQMDSGEFFYHYSRGQQSDDAVFVEWANDYRHYLEPPKKTSRDRTRCCMRLLPPTWRRWSRLFFRPFHANPEDAIWPALTNSKHF